MKKLIKSILKMLVPQHLRQNIRYLLNLQNHIEVLNENIENIQQKINAVQNENMQNVQNKLNDIHWEILKLKNIFLIKENAPLIFDKIKVPLINETLFADITAQDFIFSDFVSLKWDFKENARKLVTRFACSANGVPPDTVQDYLLRLLDVEMICEYAFLYLVVYFLPLYEDDKKAVVLENACNKLKINKYTDRWCVSDGILRYISYLILRGENEKAKKLLLENESILEKDNIAGFIPVAYLSHEIGITSEDINISAKIFERFRNQDKVQNELREYISGKSIAVVGNGPYEIGTGNGKEIDSHDIVVRFNNFEINDDYEKDYGRKTSIISTTGFGSIKDQYYYKSDFIILPTSIYWYNFSKEKRQFIYKNSGIKMLNFDVQYFTYFRNKYNTVASTGTRILYYFYRNLNIIKDIHVYGFSFDEVINAEYFKPCDESLAYSNDDLISQQKIYRDMFKDMFKNKIPIDSQSVISLKK
ncbi:hypothetical protein AGMMS50293_26220 [Spirochaetia bacterium]|nr:hypothetical protein AGMMS50293_26220 [Spirochaetia bacterium]